MDVADSESAIPTEGAPTSNADSGEVKSDGKSHAEWSYTLLGCFTTPPSRCCLTFCLPGVTFAMNAWRLEPDHIIGLFSSCCGHSKTTECMDVAACCCGYSLATLAQCHGYVGGYYRGRLRERLDIPGSPCGDCVIHQFCPCCALLQEARHELTSVTTPYPGVTNDTGAMTQPGVTADDTRLMTQPGVTADDTRLMSQPGLTADKRVMPHPGATTETGVTAWSAFNTNYVTMQPANNTINMNFHHCHHIEFGTRFDRVLNPVIATGRDERQRLSDTDCRLPLPQQQHERQRRLRTTEYNSDWG